MRKIINPYVMFFAVLFFYSGNATSQSVFYLKDSFANADLDYKSIHNIDTHCCDDLLNDVFHTVKGKYTVYRFIAIRKAENMDQTHNNVLSRELVVLKANRGKVIEALYCPLDWKELPISSVTSRSGKTLKLADTLRIDDFNFKALTNYGVNVITPNSYLVCGNRIR